MKKLKLYSSSLAATAAMLVSSGVAAQDIIPIEPPEEVNFVGLGVFAVPDYYGSTKNEAAVAPLLRYSWDGRRYVKVLGPEVSVNVIDRTDFRAGPLIRVRPRRDDDADDSVVRLMRPIPSATELGVFAAYHMPLGGAPLHQVVFSADIVANTNGVYNGPTGNLRVKYVHPFQQQMAGRSVIGAIGLGLFFSSQEFQDRYFGVNGADLALFPARGGVPYRPDSTLTSVKIPFSLSTQLNRQWMLTLAGRYERLLGDAKDSPLVSDRGDANQWSLGINAAYLF